jgi:hypothetical protein
VEERNSIAIDIQIECKKKENTHIHKREVYARLKSQIERRVNYDMIRIRIQIYFYYYYDYFYY